MDFAVSVNHRLKLKELWNLKVTVIPTVIGALGTDTKGLVQGMESFEIREQVETIQTTALLRSSWILRRDLETGSQLNSSKKKKNLPMVVSKTLERVK